MATVLADVRLPGEDTLQQVRVEEGRVTALAPAVEVPAGAEVVALEGRTLVPGLWDRHVHVHQWALTRQRVDVSTATSAGEVAAQLADHGPPETGEVLVAVGMRSATFPEPPHRDVLDAAVGDRPVVVVNVDLHTAWLNTAALARFHRPDHPDGLLREAECYPVLEALADRSPAEEDTAVADAVAAAARRGITGIMDFEFGDCLPDWHRRVADGLRTVRVDTTVYPAHLDAAIERGLPTDAAVPGTDGLLRAGHLKVFVDGALNSGTALCHDGEGRLETPPDELHALLTRAWQHGIAPAVHAIGDRAVTIALDAFEAVGCPGRIEHAQLVADDDLPRFRDLGVAAGVQPAHLVDDRDVADRLWSGRTARAYRFADLLAAGAVLEFGSDAPVTALDPWTAIAAAVTRTGDDRPPWHPEQCLGRTTALVASTRGRDRVRVGDVADLVVLDDDPATCTLDTLRAGPVHATMLAGRWTHRPA